MEKALVFCGHYPGFDFGKQFRMVLPLENVRMQEEGLYLQEFFVTLNVKRNRNFVVDVSVACVWMKINTRGEKK